MFTELDCLYLAQTAFVLGIGTNYSGENVARELDKKFPKVKMTSVVLVFEGVFCHATVTPGAVILVHAVVGPSSTVGHGALVNTGAFIDD